MPADAGVGGATVSRLPARVALLAATAIWGFAFVAMQAGLRDLPVFHLLAARFALGAALLAPFFLRRREDWRRAASRPALAVSVALFAGFALQTTGLLSTTPSRSAFLTAMSVLLVPGIVWATGTARPTKRQWGGAVLAAAGLSVLYAPAAGGAGFGTGDLLTLGAAVIFAGHLVLVERALPSTGIGPLAMSQFLLVSGLSSLSFVADPPQVASWTPRALLAIAVTGLFATAIAFSCQLFAQTRLSATEAAVILSLEPLFAAVASIGMGVERWSGALTAGGVLIVAGMLAAQTTGRIRAARPVPGSAPGHPG